MELRVDPLLFGRVLLAFTAGLTALTHNEASLATTAGPLAGVMVM